MMYKNLNIKLATCTLILLFSSAVPSAGQTRNTNGIAHADEDGKIVHSLIASIGFSNNMIYMGSNLSQDKPLYSASLAYGFRESFFASASVNHLSAFDNPVSFATLSLGYSHDLNSWLDIAVDVSRYQVNAELADTLFSNFFYGSLAVGVDWNILYTNLSVGGVFSEGSGAYLQLRNSRYFETGRFFRDKLYLSFDPYINLLAGTLTKTVTADGTVIGVSEPFKSPKSGSGQHSSSSTTDFFSLMEADFGVPVSLNAGRLTLEAEPGYILPAYQVSDGSGSEGFTLFLSLYISILE